ncbi:DNA modification methylase [Casimicrobium huifangae]|uniref:DNA modification methylase n=1 Tax=Casimicrobium huifangae TaxID=2591109 RepID=UPI003783E02B
MTAVVNRVVALDQIAPHPDNYNKHPKKQISDLRASLRKFGQVRSVVVQAPVDSGRYLCVAGHGLTEAAAAEGLTELRADVLPADWPPHKVRAYLVADNNHAKRSEVDEAQLAAMVGDIVAADAEYMAAMAFDEKDLAGMGIGAAPVEDVEPTIDRAEELRAKWGVEPGQLWRLGDHRLICGDCTDRAVVERVMGGERADCVFTDPPYGVSYADKNVFLNAIGRPNSVEKEIEHDHQTPEQMSAFWMAAFSCVREFVKPGGAYYVTGPQGGDLLLLLLALRDSGYPLRHMLIWAKNQFVIGRSDYHYQHEPVIYGWVDGAGHHFYGGRGEASLWQIDKPRNSDSHPTMKPVELYERGIGNSTQPGEVVVEPFSGSGTAIVACERLGRCCRAVEISPAYVAVALERWSVATGKTPELVP